MSALRLVVKDRRAASMPISTLCLCRLKSCRNSKKLTETVIAGFPLSAHYLICDGKGEETLTFLNSDTTLLVLYSTRRKAVTHFGFSPQFIYSRSLVYLELEFEVSYIQFNSSHQQLNPTQLPTFHLPYPHHGHQRALNRSQRPLL